MTRRRFIADIWTPTSATLTGDQAAHLARVLRAEPGQIYDVVAGGFLHRGEITAVTPEAVHLLLHEELESDTALPLHLLIAVFKFDHLEWGIEKATELGVAAITPILARRTEKHLAQSSHTRVARWRRIALETSKQSRRTSVPAIADPVPLQQALLTTRQIPNRILLSEIEQATPLLQALHQAHSRRHERDQDTTALQAAVVSTGSHPPTTVISTEVNPRSGVISTGAQPIGETPVFRGALATTHALAIGPEGGWTTEELDLFGGHHWQPVTLGPRILRAETAAIAAIAIAAAHLG